MGSINDYVKGNKAAWEEAFENRKPNWGEENHLRLKNKKLAFFKMAIQLTHGE